MICSLDEVKEHLDKTTTADDAELRAFIDSVTPVVEDYVGDIELHTYSERHMAGPYLSLRHGPVLSVQSITDWYTDAVLYVTNAVKVDTDTGKVWLKDQSGFSGSSAYQVNYTTGRTVVASNIRMGAAMIVAHNWKTQRGSLTRFPGQDDAALPPGFTYSVPRKALEYFRGAMRNKVVVA